MKIKYETATGTVEIDVDEEWGNIVIDLDRLEYNNNQAETRRHDSLDELEGTQKEPFDDTSVDEMAITKSNERNLYDAIALLNFQQRKLITQVYFEGKKLIDIAREENVSRAAITQRLARIFVQLRQKLK